MKEVPFWAAAQAAALSGATADVQDARERTEASFDRAYRPIRDYALIGDCHGAALVAKDGSIDWAALGRFDADPIFWRLLDRSKGGFFQIAPAEEYDVERAYLPNTNILRTTFRTARGRVSVTDFMPVNRAPGAPPDDYVTLEAPGVLIRIVEGLDGRAAIRVQFKSAAQAFAGKALHEARLVMESGEVCAEVDVLIELHAGERKTFIVSTGEGAPINPDAVLLLPGTRAFWEGWCRTCSYQGPYWEQVQRSALALKLLTYAPSGGIVAAPTTSLPERPGGERNWDYRFSWLRDSTLVLSALMPLGYAGEARRFCEFQRFCCVQTLPELRVMFGIGGETDLPERTLDHIEGYVRSRPVRIGNAAYCQRQMDIYGEVLDWLLTLRALGEPSDETQERMTRQVADYVVAHWQEPDQGLWEMRAEPRHHVHSKIMCWVALDRALKLAGHNDRWHEARDAILAEIREHGIDREGGYLIQAFGFSQTDASLLLACSLDLPLENEIIDRTIRAVERELRVGDYVRRYLTHDGLPGPEGAFLICSFWLVDALLFAGRADEARALFERLLARSNDVGLYAEQIDLGSEAFLGNFPQGFTHLALINSAIRLLLLDQAGKEALTGSNAERTKRASKVTAGPTSMSAENHDGKGV